jgi:hypothetical protein
LLEVVRITHIYWAIECTPNVWFVGVFELGRITYIYWAIKCTPKA